MNELDSRLELAYECNLVPRNVTYQLSKLNAYDVIGCELWWRDHNLLMDVHSLFEFLKMAKKSSRNASKLLNNGDQHSNKVVEQVNVVFNNNPLVGLTWARSFG